MIQAPGTSPASSLTRRTVLAVTATVPVALTALTTAAPTPAHATARATVNTGPPAESPASPADATDATATDSTAGPQERRLRRLLSRMTLEAKVGQLFVMRVYGHSATAPDPSGVEANLREIGVRTAAELVAKYHVGGVIYFSWAGNTRGPAQIAALSNGIQRAALAQDVPVPVLISTDQEHGIVCRVGSPATLFPGAMAIGAGGSVADARELGRIAGVELAALGIRQNYSPVADVNVDPANPVIGVRSFGSDPESVAELVAAEVRGYQGAGVAATVKHFPGHGDTRVDSHTGLPVIGHSRAEWERLDAPPFRAAVRAGVDAVMTAHLQFPALDPSGDPATLSHPIMTGILRDELGFDGVVVTDSLAMEGVRQKYGDDRVPVLALRAGVDQLLNPPDLKAAFDGVLAAVRDGEITEERLDRSVLRVLRLKERRGLFRSPYVPERTVAAVVGHRAHRAAADRIAVRGTTLLTDAERLLPLSRRTHRDLLVVGADPVSPSGTTGPPTAVLAAALTESGFAVTALSTGTAPSRERIDAAVAAARGTDAVVVTTYNAAAHSGQRTLVAELAAAGALVVAVALRDPYDVAWLPGADAVLAVYSWGETELRAVAGVLAGRARPGGRLPVPVPYPGEPGRVWLPLGHGLSYR
ncbi:glycoside hydrolase family 3 protein [Streptomyces sp. NPDC059816]|uniref:glycoside hydrolase family 3 protein n=1 Tax=Streptomyces sp. NPDC059816 TaxID=3346960 RepID=UPI003654EF9A